MCVYILASEVQPLAKAEVTKLDHGWECLSKFSFIKQRIVQLQISVNSTSRHMGHASLCASVVNLSLSTLSH